VQHSAQNATHQQHLQFQRSVGVAVVQHYHESVAKVPVACHVDLDPTATEHKKPQIQQQWYIMACFPGQPGQSSPRKVNHSDFNKARKDGVSVASAEPYANHLHLALDR